MFSEVIGIIGVGSYATCHFFRRLLDAFPGEKEWDRPQIIINNNCTMPSRVRAILYKENEERLQKELVESARGILRCAGGKKVRLVIDCNTAHYYINHLKEAIPEADFIDIIETCAYGLSEQVIKDTVLLASEGIFDTKIYDRYFEKFGISIEYPVSKEKEIRYFIECVKQNKIDKESVQQFLSMLRDFCGGRDVVLGCTELPVLWGEIPTVFKRELGERVFDPLQFVIEKLKRELK